MMKNKVPMPKEEMMRSIFRPRESTRKKTKMEVATSLTMPYIPDARSELVVPEYPIYKTQSTYQEKKVGLCNYRTLGRGEHDIPT